jgi:hypothetical protein
LRPVPQNKLKKGVPFFVGQLRSRLATQITTTSPRLPRKNTTFAHPKFAKTPAKHHNHHIKKNLPKKHQKLLQEQT